MVSFIFFLAWRYLKESTYEKTLSPMIAISFISIIVASWSLALVTAIMHGIEHGTHEKIQSIQPQIIIKSPTADGLNIAAIQEVLKKQFPQVVAASPFALQHILLRSKKNPSPTVTVLKGVEAALESQVIPIDSKIISDPYSIKNALQNNHVLIGKGIAKQLKVNVHDPIEIVYLEDNEQDTKKVRLDTVNAHVGGIFDTGIEEYDENLTFVSLTFFQQLFPDTAPTQLSLKITHGVKEDTVQKQLHETLQLPVYTWKELYPAIVSALKLEKYAMIFILLLICFVASMNIFALLFMFITQKRSNIALLYALGATPKQVMSIFIMIGMLISILGATIGIMGAAVSSYLIDHYKLITLPDVYYVSHLPAHLDWYTIVWVYLLVLCISFIAVWYPAYKTKSITIAQVLRYEG